MDNRVDRLLLTGVQFSPTSWCCTFALLVAARPGGVIWIAMARDESANQEEGLELVAFGLAFARADVERSYQSFRIVTTLAQARAGLFLAFIAWALFVAGMLASAIEHIDTAVLPIAEFAIPASALALLSSYAATTRRWFLPLSAVANAVGGLAIVAVVRALPLDRVPNFAPLVGLCALVICAYFAFTVQRLRPRDATIATFVYLVAYGLTVFEWYRHDAVARAILAGTISALAASLLTGVFACGFAERLLRNAFKQERIIEAQRKTIAAERARTEELLQEELAHQVAARSRELGKMLARADAVIAGGRPVIGGRFATRYRVVRELGAGGMGAVYEVQRETDERRLALKILTGEISAARAARFAREAEIGARIHHPNLISIVDVGAADEGVPFLVMELAPRGSLEDRRAEFGVGNWMVSILIDVARGLGALHRAGVVHRDLKPANVLLMTDDDGGTIAKISDFGISRFGSLESLDVDPAAPTVVASRPTHGITATGMLLGTPNYMAPETATRAAVDAPSDVFAFGILACELWTGRAPFEYPPIFSVLAGDRVRKPRLDDPRIPDSIGELLGACLREDPAKRPQMQTLVERLTALEARLQKAPRRTTSGVQRAQTIRDDAPPERERADLPSTDDELLLGTTPERVTEAAGQERRRHHAEPTPEREQEEEQARREANEARVEGERRR